MVSSIVPRPAAKCPPRVLTVWIRNWRSSSASSLSRFSGSARSCAGAEIVRSRPKGSWGSVMAAVYCRRLVHAVHDIVRERAQRCGGRTHACECRQRPVPVLEGQLAGALQAEYAGVAGLAAGGIGAGALAEHGRLAGHIEDVVLDLKGQADFIAVTAQGVADLVSHRARRQRARSEERRVGKE